MRVKVWDIPTRLVHWLLAGFFILAFLTSADESFLEYHTVAGYAVLGLVVFRVFWGFAGNRFARFSDFVRGFGAVKGFVRDIIGLHPGRYLGHNPAVGWIIILILSSAAAIAVTGIITYGGEENRGVWAGVFTFEAALYARGVHAVLSYLFVFVIVLHVCAALFHDFILKENIILSMITGKKEDPESWGERVAHLKPEEGPTRLGLAVWIAVAILGGLAIVFLPPEGKSDPSMIKPVKVMDESGIAVEVKPNRIWSDECAKSCHAGFHPTLLPEESWKRLMGGLEDHFGEDARVDAQTNKEILDYLVSASAERSVSEASRKLQYSLKGAQAPVRVTDVPYWKAKHARISSDVYARKSVMSKSNCSACHPGAEKGSFEDRDIGIPD